MKNSYGILSNCWKLLVGCILIVLNLNAVFAQNNPHKAPLYWTVYEHNWIKEQEHVEPNYIPESEWLANIEWVEENLKPYGYEMIAIDGWGDDSQYNEHGYRSTHSSHWDHDYAYWANYLQERGMNLGMYNNPLWINKRAAEAGVKVKGTDIPLSSLINNSENATWFTWVQVDRPGAEEYVKGYVQYYADMGIKFLRVDFLSWFEDGYDKNMGRVGPARPREHYATALRWMKEAADANDMLLSLVMPHLKNDAELEAQYGHMIRINEDVWNGGWDRFNSEERGIHRKHWSQWHNPFDGYTYWSKLAGRNNIILDGDFIRINTMANDEEKKTVISLHLMAGGPLSPADQHNTIGDDIWVYQNEELLALNQDGFVGKPLTNDPTNPLSQIWTGQMSNGDWILGLFNREDEVQTRSMDFSELDITGAATVRDLWAHADLGSMESVSVQVPPHGSVILKVVPGEGNCQGQSIDFGAIEPRDSDAPAFTLNAIASSGLPVEYEVVSGPATLNGNQLSLTGEAGIVAVVAKQPGDGTNCAALQQAQSFEVTKEERFVGGTFSNWQLKYPMQKENDEWIVSGVELNAGDHQLKFASKNDWTGDDWGNATGLSGNASLTTGGGDNISFTIPISGLYTITFNDQTLAYSIVRETLTSVEDISNGISKGQVLIFPNPSEDSITIKMSEPFDEIEITNSMGTLIYEAPVSGKVIHLDVLQFPSGIYSVKLSKKGTGYIVKKIIVRR